MSLPRCLPPQCGQPGGQPHVTSYRRITSGVWCLMSVAGCICRFFEQHEGFLQLVKLPDSRGQDLSVTLHKWLVVDPIMAAPQHLGSDYTDEELLKDFKTVPRLQVCHENDKVPKFFKSAAPPGAPGAPASTITTQTTVYFHFPAEVCIQVGIQVISF